MYRLPASSSDLASMSMLRPAYPLNCAAVPTQLGSKLLHSLDTIGKTNSFDNFHDFWNYVLDSQSPQARKHLVLPIVSMSLVAKIMETIGQTDNFHEACGAFEVSKRYEAIVPEIMEIVQIIGANPLFPCFLPPISWKH